MVYIEKKLDTRFLRAAAGLPVEKEQSKSVWCVFFKRLAANAPEVWLIGVAGTWQEAETLRELYERSRPEYDFYFPNEIFTVKVELNELVTKPVFL